MNLIGFKLKIVEEVKKISFITVQLKGRKKCSHSVAALCRVVHMNCLLNICVTAENKGDIIKPENTIADISLPK